MRSKFVRNYVPGRRKVTGTKFRVRKAKVSKAKVQAQFWVLCTLEHLLLLTFAHKIFDFVCKSVQKQAEQKSKQSKKLELGQVYCSALRSKYTQNGSNQTSFFTTLRSNIFGVAFFFFCLPLEHGVLAQSVKFLFNFWSTSTRTQSVLPRRHQKQEARATRIEELV